MLPDKYQKFLNSIIDMFEADHYQGEVWIGGEPYWIEGLNPRPQALNNARFYVYRGNVFMITDLYTKRVMGLHKSFDEDYFTIFFFGRQFHIDQTLGTEIPAKDYEGIVDRLKLGY